MRVLLDESIPIDVARDLTGLDAQTVIGVGWAGLKNGALLRQAAGRFDVLVTMDKNLHQSARRISSTDVQLAASPSNCALVLTLNSFASDRRFRQCEGCDRNR